MFKFALQFSLLAFSLHAYQISGILYDSRDETRLCGATVKLYQDINGDAEPDEGDMLVTSVETDSDGIYRFDEENGTYFVVVDSQSLSGSTDVWMEQTIGPVGGLCEEGNGTTIKLDAAGFCYGGRRGGVSDDSASITTSEHIAVVELKGTDINDLNFGFSPDVVTNVLDEGQGTLRQFLKNANAVSGANKMRFVPMEVPNSPHWWTIKLQNPLPVLSDTDTLIDGTAYNPDGSLRDENPGFSGHGGEAVGTGADGLEATEDETTLSYFADPELEIDMNDQFNTALDAVGYVPVYDRNASGVFVIDANNITIRKIALKNAAYADDEKSGDIHSAILIKSGMNLLISENFIGVHADGSLPASGEYVKNGILQLNGAMSAISKNLISHTLFTGIWAGDNTFIYKNDLYKAAMLPTGDAITTELSGGDQIRIESNRIEGASGYGIESFNAPSVVTIIENTLISNGQDATASNNNERGGIRIFGFDNVISHNVIRNHPGNGIVVTGGKTGNLISQNAIYQNGGISIDLDQNSTDYNGDGITPNDGNTESNSSNTAIDTPLFTTAIIDGDILHVEGYVGSEPDQALFGDTTIEIYKVDDDGDGNGEGRWYLGSCISDSDGNFDCNITTTLIAEHDKISAIATDTINNTSEFGPNQIVSVATPGVAECIATFPGPVSSTSDVIDLDTGVRIYNMTDNTLISKLLTTGPDVLCDGDTCLKSDTVAGRYNFTVDTGTGSDGALTRSGKVVDINESREYSSVSGESGAVFNINGDITIKTQNEFSLATKSTLNIDGNVTLHADTFLMGVDCTININSGSLKIYTNYASLAHSAGDSVVARSEEFILFSKGKIDIGTKGELIGLFFSEDQIYVKQGNTITGALTGKSAQIDPQAIITYDQPAVSRYCGDSGKPILRIADSKITEGNGGTKEMIFTISFDRPLPEDIVVDYSTGDGTAMNGDDDYEGFKKRKLTLASGSKSATVAVTINGDTQIEPDEAFYLYISSRDDVIMEDNYASGLILNDDYHLRIVAADTTDLNGTIGTKIVNQSFGLNLIVYDTDNNVPVADMNITAIDLITPSGNIENWWSGPTVTTDSDGIAHINGLVSPVAVKNAGLLIHADLYGGLYEDNSSDHFAIRPDHFSFVLPALNTAGVPVSLHAEAQDGSGMATPGYAETNNLSFRIAHQEKKGGCVTASLILSGSNHFSDGVWDQNFTYKEVGELDLNISEIPGSEFAVIDRNDTPDSQRYIGSASVTGVRFNPANLKVLFWDLYTPSPITYYASMGDLAQMGAKMQVTVRAEAADGSRLHNYTAACYAKATDLNISFDILTNSEEEHRLIWKDFLSSLHTSESSASSIAFVGPQSGRHFGYDINLSHFVEGEANETLMLNFDRKANRPKEPLRLKITNIDVNNAINTPSSGLSVTKSVDFYYGRLHAPDYTHVGDTFDARIFYEVYSKRHDPDIFPLVHGRESMDTIHWYLVEQPLPGAIVNAYGVYENGSVMGWSDDTISMKVSKLPFVEKVRYQPKGYLKYNRWSDTIVTHSFKVVFSSEGTKWAGRGRKGAVLDLNVSKRRGRTKMEW
ncbi:MAG: hypothetical protein B6D59_03795 [Campylobacteraceae bacterium 4484_4]|nr:MAG: hypothetical protein B6D59_03795 [Campylobacteraceae bacterium 4484_4]